MNHSQSLIASFAPTGKLRASINTGNPILANKGTDGVPTGVSIDLAHALAERLGIALELVVFDAALKSVDAVIAEQADFGFFAIDPTRGTHIAFTAPYVLIEGCYLVRDDSPLRANDEVDRTGNRVMVGKGSAYDLFLTRELKQAEIVRSSTSTSVIASFLGQSLEVAAGVRQQLEADIEALGGMRIFNEPFMIIRQAMGVPKSRGPEAAAYLTAFVEEMKRSGFVADALQRHGIKGAAIAPLTNL